MKFNSTPEGAPDETTRFSVDLNTRVIDHFLFLKNLHDQGVTRTVNEQSLRRYKLWIDLLAKTEQTDLHPPPDIAWLWHCHRLTPSHYNVQTKAPSGNPYELRTNHYATKAAWSKEYPDEPFQATASSKICGSTNENLAGFDLLASAERQAEFYWQLQPLFHKSGRPKFAKDQALQDYRKFLNLMKLYPGQTIVPTYRIDLYWHTHMTGGCFEAYRHDCELMCGRLINHDDGYGQGDRDGVLGEGFMLTAKLWKETYDDPTYESMGGYRGPPPSDYYTEDAEKKASKGCSSPCKRCALLVAVCVFIGATLMILGSVVITPIEYACEGVAPSVAELEARLSSNASVPVCLYTSVRDEAICLQAGLSPNDPPVYCQTGIAETQPDGFRDWYLWWSPCTQCGTAWRMYPEIDHDKSRYKLPSNKPAPGEVPLGDQPWQKWEVDDLKWLETVSVTVEECDVTDLGDDGIPPACYVEKQFKALVVVGGIVLATPIAAVVLMFLFMFCKHCMTSECSTTNHVGRNTGTAGYGGGGGGCGGGGCGGGGGGCGGC